MNQSSAQSPIYKIRKSEDRGFFDHGWLKAKHTFSFGDYQDSKHVRFRSMRVINEDRIAPGKGFPKHPHENMEIITYVLSGSLKHEDSVGNSSTILPGEVQRMSAGTGIVHSEFSDKDVETHLFQIWIFPQENGLLPSYEQKQIPPEEKLNKLCLIASSAPSEYAVKIHQDAHIYACSLDSKKSISHEISGNDRHVWIQVASGKLHVNENLISEGDGIAISPAHTIQISSEEKSEFLLFDLS